MKTKATTFSAVPVGGFFYCAPLGDWLFKASRRSAYLGACTRMNRYTPSASAEVLVVA